MWAVYLKVEILGSSGDVHIFLCDIKLLPEFIIYLLTTPSLLAEEDIGVVCDRLYALKVAHYASGITGSSN